MLRLKPGQDVKDELTAYAKAHGLKAASVVTAVGSLTQYSLRFANQPDYVQAQGHFEVLSLSGTLSDSSAHLHLSVADSAGLCRGGHLGQGNQVYTTLEVTLLEALDLRFTRETDATFGYQELAVKPRE